MEILSKERMTEVIWNMGTDLEAKGLIGSGGATQYQRFQAIAQAQLDDAIRQFVEWGDKTCTEHQIGNQTQRKRECKQCWRAFKGGK